MGAERGSGAVGWEGEAVRMGEGRGEGGEGRPGGAGEGQWLGFCSEHQGSPVSPEVSLSGKVMWD